MKSKRPSRSSVRLAVISGIVLVCAVVIAVPFFGANKEEKQFRTLSTIMKTIYSNLQSIDTSSSWRYKESCNDVYSGAFPTGEVSCAVELSLQRSVTSSVTVKGLHQSYYTVIVNNPNLFPNGTLSLSPTNLFGEKFVVSTAEARYSVKDLGDITCRYNLSLGQQNENSTNFTLGSTIEGNKGTMFATFRCSSIATNFWYEKAN